MNLGILLGEWMSGQQENEVIGFGFFSFLGDVITLPDCFKLHDGEILPSGEITLNPPLEEEDAWWSLATA